LLELSYEKEEGRGGVKKKGVNVLIAVSHKKKNPHNCRGEKRESLILDGREGKGLMRKKD